MGAKVGIQLQEL